MTAAEMFEKVIAEAAKQDKPASVLAAELVKQYNDTEAIEWEWLTDWLFDHAEQFIGRTIGWYRWQDKANQTRNARVRAFAAAADGFKKGDVTALANFRAEYDVAGTKKRVGEMTGEDHQIVADGLQDLGVSTLMLAAVHRRVAKIVGDKRTDEVLSEDAYRQLFGTARDEEDPFAEFLAG